MGNLNSSENKIGLYYTAAGNYKTPKLQKNTSDKNQINPESFNPKIYRDIFPEKTKNIETCIPLSYQSTFSDDNETIIAPRNSLVCQTIYSKSLDDTRRSYIARLIYQNIWQPGVDVKLHNSLIIFDWDDTLLPTTFLTPNGFYSDETVLSEVDSFRVKRLDDKVFKLLNMAAKRGDIYIITNAAPGWVEYSAQRFYSQVYKILKNVKIISARGEFEKYHPGDSRQWKIEAYLKMIKNMNVNLITNIICLGDSIIEIEAAHILASKFCHAYIKTIKFREMPKPEELDKQLNLVINQFDQISSVVKNLTIQVDKKTKEKL
jgi:hypothetical protein